MRRLRPALASAALLLLAGRPGAAAEPSFERIGREGGPPSEVVTALLLDRAGFLWVGGRDGLVRYDGYAFARFVHDPLNADSLSDNSVRTLYEDRRGDLWVGTNAGGLDRLDRTTGRFQAFRHDSANPASLSHDSVYAIVEGPDGALWIGTQRGLNRLDATRGQVERIRSGPGGLPGEYVQALAFDGGGRLWVGLWGNGLAVMDTASRAGRSFRHDAAQPRSLGGISVFALHRDPAGRMWVGTNVGLDVARDDGGFDHVTHTRAWTGPVVDGPDGTLWVGAMGDGLFQVEASAARVIRQLRHADGQRGSLGDDRIMALDVDAAGNLWVGTWGAGLQRLTAAALFLAAPPPLPAMPSGMEAGDVTAMARDATGRLYVGLRSGALLMRDDGRAAWRRFDIARGDLLLRLLPTRDGRVLIGSAEGLYRMDPASGRSSRVAHAAGDPRGLGPGYVSALAEDRSGRVWVGTGEGGLQRLDEGLRVVERHVHDPADPASLSDDYVIAILEDGAGTLWVGTRSGGLNAFDPKTGRVVRSSPEFVGALVEDRKRRLWAGTGGGGLVRVEREATGAIRLTRLTMSQGLADDTVMAMLSDDDGTLWLSTKGGLSRFDPETGRFASLWLGDGLPSVEFEPGSAARGDGRLFFGSVRGVVAVPTGTPFVAPAPSATAVTSLHTVEDEGQRQRPVLPSAREWRLPWGQWLSMELAVLDFGLVEKHAYAYRLGPDAPWVELGARRSITFTNLAPGRYEVAARGRNSQGVWSETTAPIRIEVVPPFWMTGWLRGVVAVLLIGAAFVVHGVRTAALRRRNRQLEELQDGLRLLTRRLEAAKEEERVRIARELHDELGPTLTAVIINLQLAGDASAPGRAARLLADSVGLVDGLIQRVRDLSLDLRPPLLDEMGLRDALVSHLEAQADRAGIAIEVRAGPLPRFDPEIETAAFRIAQEAVTNVVRHAAAKSASVGVKHAHGRLTIVVEDDGLGFEPPSRLHGTDLGKRLGLLGMEERARALGGDFSIDSGRGRGTRVRVSLPAVERG